MYINFPKDNYIYRGSNLETEKKFKKYKPVWFTTDIRYACKYVPKNNGAVKIYKLKKDLNLINLKEIDINKLPNKKNIKIGKIHVSLKELYQIILGIGYKKTDNKKPLEEQKDTQLYMFLKLTEELNRGDKTLAWLKIVSDVKNRKIIKNKNKFNRLSDGQLDFILLKQLKKNFPEIDGYYAPHIDSNWSIINCNCDLKKINKCKDKLCTFYQFQEIALVDIKKICLDQVIEKDVKKLCKILS